MNEQVETLSRRLEYSGSLKLTRELRQASTDAESFLWDRLRNRKMAGFKFRRQHQVGMYVTDFYCREAKLVIECDGVIHAKAESWHHDQNREAYMSSLDCARCDSQMKKY